MTFRNIAFAALTFLSACAAQGVEIENSYLRVLAGVMSSAEKSHTDAVIR